MDATIKTAKHTSGPWEISGGALRIVSQHEWVATVEGASPENGLSPSDPVALANARLISAAPDLLALARMIVGEREAVARGDTSAATALDQCESWAKAAISKAIG